MRFVEQILRQRIGIAYRTHIREEIEGTLRLRETETGDLPCQTNDQFPPTRERIQDRRINRKGQCGLCRSLSRHGSTGELLTLQTAACRDKSLVFGQQPTDTVAGHGIRFAHAIDDNQPFRHVGICRQRQCRFAVGERAVYLICEHHHLRVVAQYRHQTVQLRTRIDRTGGVIRRTE